jgi:transposase
VKQSLVPTRKHGDIVVMDNLPIHNGIAQAIEALGARLALSSANPIELAFSKVKAHLRKTVPRLLCRISCIAAAFPA